MALGRAPSWPFKEMRCCRTYTLETGRLVCCGTLESRIRSSTPGLVASHRVEMRLPGTWRMTQEVPHVAALGLTPSGPHGDSSGDVTGGFAHHMHQDV